MKQKLREFIENCLKIKVHDESATQIPLKGKWQQFNYYASFGKGAFAYVPWLGFFAFNQVVTKGIYPVILYNTKANNLNFEVCYGISATSAPDVYWNVKYTQNLQHSNTPKYTQSFVKKSYTINTIEDFEINADDIIQQINSILNDFNEQFSSNDSEEQLLESLILQYASFKNSAEYDEQYKWDYASKHKNEFDNLDDFENKINGLGNYNFRPYFLQRTGQNHLMEPYNIETFKSSLKILLDESVDVEQRINKFLENLRNLLKNDEHWNNKDMMPDETDASYFLFTNDYTKYLLFNPKTAFNNFAKRFNLSDLLDKNDRVKRYIKIQDYCNNILLPKMNRILNKTHTLLDAQDFIRYVDNINSVENLRTELLEYYTDLNFIIDDTPNDYTAIKSEKNIAEVHRVNSKNTKFRVIINYDKLPENMRDNCKRVPDSYGWTLNGECWVTSRNSLDDVIRKIDSTLGNFVENNYENHKEIDKMNIPLNQILYGPPGTGKTYNTVLKAMSIIDNTEYKDVSEEQYSALKTRFDELKQAGQIEFVTFHQSYSYEEFVEGIKPYIPEWGTTDNTEVRYIGENGIFKRICKKAESPIIKSNDNNLELNDNPKIWKVSLMKTGENDIRKDCMGNNRIRIGFDKYGETINDETIFDDGGSRVLSAFIDKMEIGDIVLSCYSEKTIDAIGVVTSEYKWNNDFPQYKRYREVKWLAKGLNHNILEINNGTKFTLGTVYQLNNMSLKDVLDIVDEQEQVTSYKDNDKPYILIIDEINRGDVSKIFGELITLIEEDKRIGNKYQMKTTLPYSKESFGVPNNLYIIGTMNTADRSIALLDTALRRRFDFEEIMPGPELLGGKVVEGINLQTLLTRINERITNKYDRDHQIGHSYLMGVNTKEQLERAYKNRILPLLNEYFYNESKTVAEILNCSEDELRTSDFISILGKAQGA